MTKHKNDNITTIKNMKNIRPTAVPIIYDDQLYWGMSCRTTISGLVVSDGASHCLEIIAHTDICSI